MANYLVTGGGRGIGFLIAERLAARDAAEVAHVFVTTRGKYPAALTELIDSSHGRVINVTCQVVDEQSVKDAAAEIEAKLGGAGLDVVINNIGICPVEPEGIATMSGDALLDCINVNVASAQRISAAMLPLLRKGSLKRIINISTTLGSLAYVDRYTWAPTTAYKVSKAAMNMLTVQWALSLDSEGFTVTLISPGYIRTDATGPSADLDLKTGGDAVFRLINSISRKDNGKFLNLHVPGWEKAEGPNQYDGAEIPW